jgi:hypothetical protein
MPSIEIQKQVNLILHTFRSSESYDIFSIISFVCIEEEIISNLKVLIYEIPLHNFSISVYTLISSCDFLDQTRNRNPGGWGRSMDVSSFDQT